MDCDIPEGHVTLRAEKNWCDLVKLLVVIVNYRVAHLAIDCLHSVAEEIGRVPGTHVAICENGTGDDSAERIQQAIDRQWLGVLVHADRARRQSRLHRRQ